MKKNIIVKANYFPLLVLLIGFIIVFSKDVSRGVLRSLTLCAETLIPSLFISLIVCRAAVYYCGKKSTVYARFFEKLFRLPGSCADAFLLAMIGGYPIGPMMCAALFEQGKISAESAKRFMLFSCSSGAAFCVVAVGETMLGSKKTGLMLLASGILSQVLMGLALRLFYPEKSECKVNNLYEEPLPVASVFTDSVDCAIRAMLCVCAYVLVFGALMALSERLPLPPAAQRIFSGAMEVTGGCALFRSSPPAIAFFLGFGGLSVFFQIKKYLVQTGTSSLAFLAARLASGVLCFLICKGLLAVFPQALPAMAGGVQVRAVSYSAPLSAVLVLTFSVFILDNKHMRQLH